MAHRALLLPEVARPLGALLVNLLAEMDVELVEDAAHGRPEIVFVFVDTEGSLQRIGAARAHRVPIIVLTFYDQDRIIERIRLQGVESIYPLGHPLAELRQLVASSLATAPPSRQ